MTLLTRLKLLLGLAEDDASQDEVLILLLSQAKAYIKDYCHIAECGTELDALALAMACEDWSKLGASGVSYRSLSGAYEAYRSAYSDNIMAQLRAKRRPALL